jgi:hypothetical protein
MIDNLTLENFIINSSQSRFDSIVRLLLKDVFHIDATNVDAKGDGGGDFVTIPVEGGPRAFVGQVTVKDQSWEAKAKADADKAVKELKCTRYFFFTCRRHESATLRKLESKISTKHKIPATCLGGKEIADILISNDLVFAAFELFGMPLPASLNNRLDRSEILLHSYVALGTETADLRHQVYDDTILIILRDSGPKKGEKLVHEAIALLGCDLSREGKFRGRLDYLLSRKWIVKNADTADIDLTPRARNTLDVAERIYSTELDSLASSQAALLEKKHGVEWPKESAQKCSLLLARAFIKRHLDTLQASMVHINRLQLTSEIGDPIQELRDYISHAGVPVVSVNSVLEELANNAADSPLINKLVRGALYAALEGQNSLRASRVLGVASWDQVTVIVDASVLIPFICAKMYRPTSGRFSRGAIECIEAFRQSGAKLVTTQDYINEAASHLLKARDYAGLKGSDRFLAYSVNGYVSHFFNMREQGLATPDNLAAFLAKFSRSILHEQESGQWIRAIMADIHRLASEYGIQYEHIKKVEPHYSDVVDREYGHLQHERQIDRADILFEHDARTLSSMRKNMANGITGQMCLTWDRTLIDIARKVGDCGWVVSPHDACDFIQLSRPPSGHKLISLSHRLARARERPSEIVGELLDRIMQVADPSQMDWQMRDRLEALHKELLGRTDTTSPEYDEWARQKKNAFLKEIKLKAEDIKGAE